MSIKDWFTVQRVMIFSSLDIDRPTFRDQIARIQPWDPWDPDEDRWNFSFERYVENGDLGAQVKRSK